jgi:hypothetical protein
LASPPPVRHREAGADRLILGLILLQDSRPVQLNFTIATDDEEEFSAYRDAVQKMVESVRD